MNGFSASYFSDYEESRRVMTWRVYKKGSGDKCGLNKVKTETPNHEKVQYRRGSHEWNIKT